MKQGCFKRLYTESSNPRLRVNDTHISLDPKFGSRSEACVNGLALIESDVDLFSLSSAQLSLELWGGHPGTSGKRVSVNGRGSYYFPQSAAEYGHCTYDDLEIPVAVSDLVRGENALQFACDRGTSFWGHFIIDQLALELFYKNPPEAIERWISTPCFIAELYETSPPCIQFTLSDDALKAMEGGQLTAVDILSSHDGIRLPLDGQRRKYRGFRRNRKWSGPVLRLDKDNPKAVWDLSWLSSNISSAAFMAELSFSDGCYYRSEINTFSIADDIKGRMVPFFPVEQPAPFWSRAGELREAWFSIDHVADREWKLQIRVWNGGAGDESSPLKLNDRPLRILNAGAPHDLESYEISINPGILKAGLNRLSLLSNTEHHGIEILYPGPVLLARDKYKY